MPVSGNANNDGGPSSTTETIVNYRQKYRNLKRKFRYLIYENECFQDELQRAQRKLLKVNQDKSFLLDRLLHYEKLDDSSSDSDATISSDSELDNLALKRKKAATTTISALNVAATTSHTLMSRPQISDVPPKRKKAPSKANKNKVSSSPLEQTTAVQSSQGDGHMTSEEIERHLESRQILMDLLPERAPPTVPTEMFSNDPSSMESEQNEAVDTSPPSNLGDAFGEDDSLIIDLPDQQSCI